MHIKITKKKQFQTIKSSNPIGLKNKIFKPTTQQQPYSAEHWKKFLSSISIDPRKFSQNVPNLITHLTASSLLINFLFKKNNNQTTICSNSMAVQLFLLTYTQAYWTPSVRILITLVCSIHTEGLKRLSIRIRFWSKILSRPWNQCVDDS